VSAVSYYLLMRGTIRAQSARLTVSEASTADELASTPEAEGTTL
jgi:hypothetical protein